MNNFFCTFFVLVALSVTAVRAQPANNNFSNAWTISGTLVSTNGSTAQPSNATKESGEPNHAGLIGGRSVWFNWTAPASGVTRVSTAGSSFNTLLAVYTGTAVNALAQVAANDNFSGQGNTSRVEFTAEQGTTYRIAIDGRNGSGSGAASGSYNLTLQMLGSVAIASPTNGSVLAAGGPISFTVAVSTPSLPVSRVDFYHNGTLFDSAAAEPFSARLIDAPLGTNRFFAVMTDSASLSWTSAVVNVLVLNPGVTILSPLEGALFLNTNSIAVSAVGLIPGSVLTNAEFFVDGQKFGESSASPFSAMWSEATPGVHRLAAIGRDDSGLAHVAPPVLIGVARTLVATGSVWRFLDNGSDQGTAWRAPAFDDGGWTNGPAQLGYGDGDEATVVSFGTNASSKYTTTYFRQAFAVEEIASYTNLLLRVLRDDGAAVYLNGVEAARFNMPTGIITSASFAATTASDDGTTFFPANVSPALLVEGTNLVAVELHQSDLTSSDISFELELLGVPMVPHNQPPLVSFLNPTNGEVFFAPTNITLEASAVDADGSVARLEFFADGVKLGEATNGSSSFAWNPSIGAHLLRVVATDNEGARGASASISVTAYDAIGSPLVRITTPAEGAVVQGPTNVLIAAALTSLNGVTNLLFLANDMIIGEDTASPWSVVWSNAAFGTNRITAIASDSLGVSGTSAVVSVFISPPPDNTIAPTIVAASPSRGAVLSNLTSVQVTFTERVAGVNAADLLVNGAPASGVNGSGSNYTFIVAPPAFGIVIVAWETNHGIMDTGFPPLPFDGTAPGETWTYDLREMSPPTVASRIPAANASVTNLTQVRVTFSEPVSGVDAADLLINGTPASALTSSTNTIYTFAFAQPPSGPVTVSWRTNHGIADLALFPNAFNATGAGATWTYTLDARTILVQSNAAWQFIKGTAEASAPMDAWRAPAFDHSNWSNSPAPFYYGDPYNTVANPGTLLGDMQGNYTSIYLRKEFTVANLSAVTNLFLNAQSDDGFIAWINGVEIYRYNMPTGDISYNAVTLTSISEPQNQGAAYISYALPDPAAYLVEGPNLLAVHAFNQSLTASSDFGFNAQLYTYLADASVAAPRLLWVEPAPGEVFDLTNVTVTFTEPVSGVDAPDLVVNGLPANAVSSVTNTTYTFSLTQPPFGPIVITWTGDHGIVDWDTPPKPFDGNSPASTWRYTLLNPGTPTILSQTPPAGATVTNLTEITVTFGKPVTGVDAADLLVNDAPASAVTSETNTAYTFRFGQPPFGAVFIRWATNHEIQSLDALDFDPNRPGGHWNYSLIDPVPVVVLINPTNDAVFQTPVNISLQAGVADNDGFITRVEFYAGTNKLGEDTNTPFTFSWRNVPPGDYSLLAVATDNSGHAATSVPVNVHVLAGATALILSGDLWRYLDNGTDQSNAWRELSFDDSAWASGPSELGYGDTSDGRPEATLVSFGTNTNNKYITTYFRRAFTVADVSALTNLTLRLLRDDGAAVYLNGVEIFRANLPAGDLNYLTPATTNVLGPDEARFFPGPVNPALLTSGSNVLAVEVHQNLPTSADVSFDLELIANLPPVPPTVALTSPTNNTLLVAPTDITLRANAADDDGVIIRVEFFEGANKLGDVTNAPFALTWTNVQLGGYTLFAVATDNHGLLATSPPISITVTDSLPIVLARGPYLQIGTPISGVVRWRTDLPSDGVVFYGEDPAALTNLSVQAMRTNEHIVQITGLQPDTKYFYSIGSSTRRLAGGINYWFVTSPLPGSKKPTRIWVLGDPGTANNNQRNVRDAYSAFAAATRPADFWLMLGDNAYQSGTDTEYQNAVFNMYPDTLRNLFLWPTIGNHETDQSFSATDFAYLHIFSLPQNGEAGGIPSGTEKYYSFDYANIHFICLDSMTSGRTTNTAMVQWLENDLAGATAEWLLVFFHHPPYTKGNHNSDGETELVQIRENILPILEAGGVDLVLNGHSHAWERSYLLHGHYGFSSTLSDQMKVDGGDGRVDGTGAYRKNDRGEGTAYIVAGNAGQITGGSLNHAAHYLSLNELGSMIVDVVSNQLDVIMLATNGTMRDHFTLLKALPDIAPPAAPLNLLARATVTNEITLTWTDVATNEAGFALERSLDGTNFVLAVNTGANVTSAIDGGLIANVTYFYRVRAFNSAGQSDFSNVASATTVIPIAPPSAPSELVVSAGNGVDFFRSQIVLRWHDRSTNEAGFVIERSEDGSAFSPVGTVGADVTLHVDRGLASATAYYYRVRSFNQLGNSTPSSLDADSTHPQSELVLVGASVRFHGGVEGVPPVHYQWHFMGTALSGETNETLTIGNAQLTDEGAYTVAVTDGSGRTISNPAWLFVLSPPVIVEHPADRTNTIGSTAIFRVLADGAGPLRYQWRRNGVPLAGAESEELAITNIGAGHVGDYDVTVENDLGSVTSHVARLVINTPPFAGADSIYRLRGADLVVDIADLLANDFDADGDAVFVSGVATNSSRGGAVSLLGRYIFYTPPASNNDEDTFTYTLADSRGGLAPGLVNISVTDNTPPALAPLPDVILDVLAPLVLTNTATDTDIPKNALTHSLEPGAPVNSRIHPLTGVFHWTPTRQQAPSTNLITVRVTDDGRPPMTNRTSFSVTVNDYVELTVGLVVLRAGENGSVPLDFFSSASFTTFDCLLYFDDQRLTNVTIEALTPQLMTASLQRSNSNCAILSFIATPGHSMQGTQALARLLFAAIPGQASAFVPLGISAMNCTRTVTVLTPTSLVNNGLVVVIGERPILEPRLAAAGQRDLAIYGQPGVTYTIESSADATLGDSWTLWKQVTMTNLFQVLSMNEAPASSIFFRARE